MRRSPAVRAAPTLQAIHSDAQALNAALSVERSARVAVALTEKQHASGYIDHLVLLNAQRTVYQASQFGNSAAL
jgi:outer membrane protein TolC